MEIKIGQKWKENDPRFLRVVEVMGFDENGKVIIKTINTGRITKAMPQRFNGKRGCYAILEDSE